MSWVLCIMSISDRQLLQNLPRVSSYSLLHAWPIDSSACLHCASKLKGDCQYWEKRESSSIFSRFHSCLGSPWRSPHSALQHNSFPKVGRHPLQASEPRLTACSHTEAFGSSWWQCPLATVWTCWWQRMARVAGRGLFSSFFEWCCQAGLMAGPGGMVGGCADSDLGWTVERHVDSDLGWTWRNGGRTCWLWPWLNICYLLFVGTWRPSYHRYRHTLSMIAVDGGCALFRTWLMGVASLHYA